MILNLFQQHALYSADACGCGCTDGKTLPTSCTLAIASVPIQEMEELYPPEKALSEGTAFPSLNLPFFITDPSGKSV